MKKFFAILCLISMSIMASTSPFAKKLVGVWKIQSMDIKGVKMMHEQLGLPYIEFNDEGGFMIKVSSSAEKGRYSFKGNTVTLRFVVPKKPLQKMIISRLDDKEMDYTISDSSGEVKAVCYRITTGFDKDKGKDKDKD